MTDLLGAGAKGPLKAHWSDLLASAQFWIDELIAVEFARGVLHLVLAKQLYGASSKELVDGAAKSPIWVSALPFHQLHFAFSISDLFLCSSTGFPLIHHDDHPHPPLGPCRDVSDSQFGHVSPEDPVNTWDPCHLGQVDFPKRLRVTNPHRQSMSAPDTVPPTWYSVNRANTVLDCRAQILSTEAPRIDDGSAWRRTIPSSRPRTSMTLIVSVRPPLDP
ncbi:hypothetical protein B296_00037175 [Ensete ventricosum]|uniref:Uncharacterized protein n=1 Tax=Ensete ventricosum TaxID=4639 RepID=A0A426ZMI4_ENSVE|nr:hypothetical protein B296_00037175 [Ensete ventricosum]